MDKKYLTISEFAKLRDVSIGSLRYYEKLNILVPAYIDPKTRYRYYLPEQLATLDAIILCISLDIPLKEMNNYMDEKGYLDLKSILISGENAMQTKISEMQKKLKITRFTLESINREQEYNNVKGIYKREIEERFFIESPFRGNIKNLSKEARKPSLLFREAQEAGLAPIFPPGVIFHCEKEPTEISFFFRVLHPNKRDSRIIRIPKGTYSCMQADIALDTDIKKTLDENFPERNGKMIIVSNMLTSTMHFDSRCSEIQMLEG